MFDYSPSGGSMYASMKLKEIDGVTPPGVEFAVQFDSTRRTSPGLKRRRMLRLKLLADFCSSGAWPFLIRGVNCLVNSDNE